MLTEKGIAALVVDGGRREVADGSVEGLWLRVGRRRKTWVLRYRLEGRTRRMGLGTWPEVGLRAARAAALAARSRVMVGEDPGADAMPARSPTVDEVAQRFAVQELPALAPRTAREYRRLLEREILPALGHLEVPAVDLRLHVTPWLDELRLRGRVLHNRARSLLSRLLRFAAGRGIEVNVAVSLAPLAPERGRSRWLSSEELRELLPALARYRGCAGLVLRMVLLTGQRVTEVAGMRWDQQVEPGLWAMTQTKSGAPHVVPILPLAAAVMARGRGLHPELVFPGPNGVLPITSISHAAARICLALGWTAAHRFTPRDLRRTTSTGLASLGVQPHIIDHLLNHKMPGVRGVYDHYRYSNEKRAALALWETSLARLQSQETERFSS